MPDPQASETDDALIGAVVGNRYRVTELLGTGGMGAVYRAEHIVIGKSVALKVLRDVGDNSIVARRFEREAFATGRIEHPNCVTASDGGQLDDGRLFLAMELVDGVGLAEILAAEKRLPIPRAIRITAHVLRGLAFAHKADIVHRDIKPENIVLVEQGGDPDFAKILDFGIAKLLDDDELEVDQEKATQIGTTIGTPAYMSPEQAFGQRVDARADIYATGVMLFEMVTGRTPFVADDNASVLAKHVRDPVPAIADVAPEVAAPAVLDQLIRDAMAKERRERIPNAQAFLERLAVVEAALATMTVEPTRATSEPAIRATSEPPVEAIRATTEPPVRATTEPPLRATTEPPLSPGTSPATAVLGRPTPAPMPAQVVALPEPRRRWTPWRLAAMGVGILGFLGLLALLGGGGGGTHSRASGVGSPTGLRAPPSTSAVAAEARGMYDDQHYDAVIAYLEAKRAEIRGDAAALLVLGHAYGKERRYGDAIKTYRAAGELHPRIGDDREVAATIAAALDGRRDDRAAAQSLVEQQLKRPSAGALRAMLVKLAVDEDDMARRQWARGLGERYNLDGLDRLRSLSLDLEQERNCNQRKKVVEAMVALRDKRAIEILENARKRVRRTGFFRRRRNTNSCLSDDIDRAIAQLRTL